MKITFRYYGLIADITAKLAEEFLVNEIYSTSKSIRNFIETTYPELKSITYQIAVKNKFLNDETILLDNEDEIVLLPPFAGG
jgi:molybdopterin converting factor small subunit